MHAWGDFLRGLKNTDDYGETLLDHSSVLLTSNLGNSSSHDNRNMPVLVAGGGFRHVQHLAFERKNNLRAAEAVHLDPATNRPGPRSLLGHDRHHAGP